MNPGEKYEQDIPKRLQNDAIFAEKVSLTRRCAVVYVVTSDQRLFEVRQRAILCQVPLTISRTEQGRQHPIVNNSRLFNDTPYEMETSPVFDCHESPPSTVNVTLFRANDGTKRKLFILVQLDRTLVVVERRTTTDGCDDNGQLVVHSRYEDFRQLCFVENVHRPGSGAVRIELEDRDGPIVTDFQDTPSGFVGRVGAGPSLEDNFTCFDEVLKMLRDQTTERKAQLATAQLTVCEVFHGMNERMKTVPPLLRSSIAEEKVPLVRYGEVWQKIHNDRLLIGVPVYNSEQFEIEPIVVVQSPDLGVVQLREEPGEHVVRVRPLAGVLPLRLNHTVQVADRDQIVLVLLERLELRYHIVMEEAGRAEVRHRHPVHVDLVVRMLDLVQQGCWYLLGSFSRCSAHFFCNRSTRCSIRRFMYSMSSRYWLLSVALFLSAARAE
uniref:Uncharacterized protein n=1 Tax=Anopheles merus TaxID=30066 RepID=A0A182UMV4_ANOME